MPDATEVSEDEEAKAAALVQAKCQIAQIYVAGLSDPADPEARGHYEHHRDAAIASALAIRDEFYQGFAIHQVIELCRKANDLDIAKTLFREIDDDDLRERILKDVPELAGEKKRRLSDDDKARSTVTINLDQLDREAIVREVAKAMRDVGTPERDIVAFQDGTVGADYDTLLASAIGWKAPVRFLKDGKQWARGDWRRLTRWQRIRRRVALTGGSYTHPDGMIELDFDEKAGVDPLDSEQVRDEKINRYFAQQRNDRPRNLGSMLVALAVFLVAIYFGLPFWLSFVLALLIGVGLHLLVTGRWPT